VQTLKRLWFRLEVFFFVSPFATVEWVEFDGQEIPCVSFPVFR